MARKPTPRTPASNGESLPGERIAKCIAAAGICSRREAEVLIAQRRVTVDNQIVITPATRVLPEQVIKLDGERVNAPAAPRLWLYNKPAGLLTTHHDDRERPTVFDHLPPTLPRVISVGRLDLNSEGLLLLTTSGTLSRYLELPSTGWKRRYRVRVDGRLAPHDIEQLRKGMTIDGMKYGPAIVEVDDTRDARNQWLHITLAEGKNREIRRLMEACGLHVSRLLRVSYGPFQLGALPRGEVKEVPAATMRAQLGSYYDELVRGGK